MIRDEMRDQMNLTKGIIMHDCFVGCRLLSDYLFFFMWLNRI